MSRLFNEGPDVYFSPGEDNEFYFELDESNFMAHVHRILPMYNRIAIVDPRDETPWVWWQVDRKDPEEWESLYNTACMIGTVIMRGTPFDHILDQFDRMHQLTEIDMLKLLGENHGE